MPIFFDNIMGAMGVPDPYQELKDYSAAQAAKNRAALGDPTAPPGGTQPDPATTLPPDQTPQATKTPQDMGSIIVDLQRRKEAEQGWNQAIGAGFAAFSQPRDRERVSKMFNYDRADPMKLGESIMAVNSQQQGQDRTNAILRMINDPTIGPQIARAYGMDWAGLKAGALADPGLVAKIAQTWGTADEKVRAGTQVGHGALGGVAGGGAPGVISDVGKQVVADVGGQPDMTSAQMVWDAKHPGQPTPWGRNDIADFKRYTEDQNKRVESAAKFRDIHGSGIDKATEFQHRVEALKTDPGMVSLLRSPNAYRVAIDWIRKNPDSTEAALANALPDWAGYPPEVKHALAEIQLLRSRDYAQALHSIGQRFSTQEVQNVSKGMDTLLNIELGEQGYTDNLDQLVDETKTVRANSHGAAQDFDTMDPDLRTYVNPTFTKGGRSNITDSGSEDWADSVKPTKAEIDEAKAAIEKGVPRRAVERRMREVLHKRPMGF